MTTCKNCGNEYSTDSTSICLSCGLPAGHLMCLECGLSYQPEENDNNKCPACDTDRHPGWEASDFSYQDEIRKGTMSESDLPDSSNSDDEDDGNGDYGFDVVPCPSCATYFSPRRGRCPNPNCQITNPYKRDICKNCGKVAFIIPDSPSPFCMSCQASLMETCEQCGSNYLPRIEQDPDRWFINCPYCEKVTCEYCEEEYIKTAKQPSCPNCISHTCELCDTSYMGPKEGHQCPNLCQEVCCANCFESYILNIHTTQCPHCGYEVASSSSSSSSSDPGDGETPNPDSSSSSSSSSSDPGDGETPLPDSSSSSSSSSSDPGDGETPYPDSSSSSSSSSSDPTPPIDDSSSSPYPDDIVHPPYPEPTPYGEDEIGPEKGETPYPCPCDKNNPGSTSTSQGSVDLSIAFGSFPMIPGLSAGSLFLHQNMLDMTLLDPLALRFDHIIERKINSITDDYVDAASPNGGISVLTEKGYDRFHAFTNSSADRMERFGGSQIYKEVMHTLTEEKEGLASNLFEEALEDGTLIRYKRSTGTLHSLKTPLSDWITAEQLCEEVRVIRQYDTQMSTRKFNGSRNSIIDGVPSSSIPEGYDSIKESILQFGSMTGSLRQSPGYIRQIWSRTDGLLDIVISPYGNGYTISWYAPEDISYDEDLHLYMTGSATPVKTWTIRGETEVVTVTEEEEDIVSSNYGKTALIKGLARRAFNANLAAALTAKTNQTQPPGTTHTITRLTSLDILEERGDLSFRSRWKQYGDNDLLFIRGEGEEAEVCHKTRQFITYIDPTQGGTPMQIRGDVPGLDSIIHPLPNLSGGLEQTGGKVGKLAADASWESYGEAHRVKPDGGNETGGSSGDKMAWNNFIGGEVAKSVNYTKPTYENGNPITMALDEFSDLAIRPNGLFLASGKGFPGASTRYAAADVTTTQRVMTSGIMEIKRYFKGEDTFHPGVDWETIPLCGYTCEYYERFEFGDVLTMREEGDPTGHLQKTLYRYEHNLRSRNYARLVSISHPDGSVTTMNYDKNQRLITRTEPWAGGGEKITRYTYCNVRFNDQRLASITEIIQPEDGEEYQLSRKTFVYEETPSLHRITETSSALGAEYDTVEVREWHGPAPDPAATSCTYATGQPKLFRTADGIEQTFIYEDTEEYGSHYKCTVTQTVNGEIVAGKSTQTVTYYNDKGETTCEEELVHISNGEEDGGGDAPCTCAHATTSDYGTVRLASEISFAESGVASGSQVYTYVNKTSSTEDIYPGSAKLPTAGAIYSFVLSRINDSLNRTNNSADIIEGADQLTQAGAVYTFVTEMIGQALANSGTGSITPATSTDIGGVTILPSSRIRIVDAAKGAIDIPIMDSATFGVARIADNGSVRIDSEGFLYMDTAGLQKAAEEHAGVASFPSAGGLVVDHSGAAGIMPGLIIPWGGNTVPDGWLECNGASLSRAAYSELFSAIGTLWGSSDSATFKIPDLRGWYLSGWDHGAGRDSGRTLASYQADATQRMIGAIWGFATTMKLSAEGPFYREFKSAYTYGGSTNTIEYGMQLSFDNNRYVRTASKNRPENVSVMFLIKY